jgi:hypothetical protein
MKWSKIKDDNWSRIADGWARHAWMEAWGEWADDGDYIAEGTIDPDEVSSDPGVRIWSDSWQGWDCQEGDEVYLSIVDDGIRVVHRWWRTAYTRTRHDRDLWRIAMVAIRPWDIAAVMERVDPAVARRLWGDLRPSLTADQVGEIAASMDADRRRVLGLR